MKTGADLVRREVNAIAIVRTYETLYIVDPNIMDEQLPAVIDKFSNVIAQNGGEVITASKWEKRRLAYEVANRREGTYVLMYFNSEPTVVKELDRVMRISEDVVRHLIVLDDGNQAAAAKERAMRPQPMAAPAPAPVAAPVEAPVAAEAPAEPETTEAPAEPVVETPEPAAETQSEETAGEQATE